MSINEILEKIKPFYTLILGLTLAVIFFGLGRLSNTRPDSQPIKVEYDNTASVVLSEPNSSTTKIEEKSEAKTNTASATQKSSQDGNVIGAKTSKKYYYPWCGTVKRIKAQNQVYFRSIKEAREAGYLPGGNCKGLK